MHIFGITISEGLFELLYQVIGGIAALLLTAGLTWLNRFLKAKANITLFENEALLRERLFEAINNGVTHANATINGDDIKDKDIREATLMYLRTTVPDTLRKLKLSDDQIAVAVQAQIAKATQAGADYATNALTNDSQNEIVKATTAAVIQAIKEATDKKSGELVHDAIETVEAKFVKE